MDLATLAPYAAKYEAILRSVNDGFRIEHIASKDHFINIYMEVVPPAAGAYVIHVPTDIIYIGKAQSFDKRIWFHLNAPVRQGLDDRYFFSGSRFLVDQTIGPKTHGEIHEGLFRIDYFTVSDPALADGLEVYLQSVYWAKEGRHPKGNKQFG
jgi:hypothetical protein